MWSGESCRAFFGIATCGNVRKCWDLFGSSSSAALAPFDFPLISFFILLGIFERKPPSGLMCICDRPRVTLKSEGGAQNDGVTK
jgi:hypothetical protein